MGEGAGRRPVAQRLLARGVRRPRAARPARSCSSTSSTPRPARRTGSASRAATCSGPTLLEFGTEAQRKRFLPAIAAVEELWGQGFSEPDAGSDLASLKTRAERDGDEWVVTGQKIWTTFGVPRRLAVRAVPDQPRRPPPPGASRCCWCPSTSRASTSGRSATSPAAWSSARCSSTAPAPRVDNVVGEVDGGWTVVMGTLGNERAGATVLPFQAGFQREMRRPAARSCKDRGLDRDLGAAPAAEPGVGRAADHGAQQRPACSPPCCRATTRGRSRRSASCTGRTGTATSAS